MKNRLMRGLSYAVTAAMIASALPVTANAEDYTLFDLNEVFELSELEGGKLYYNDFEDKDLGSYSDVSTKGDLALFDFQVIDGSETGKDSKVLKLAKAEGATGDGTKEKITIGSWSWGESAGHTIITSFSAASALNDGVTEQITYALAGGNSAADIAGDFRMSKGKIGFGLGDGTAAPKDSDISGLSYGENDWHKILMVTSVNDDNKATLTKYYLDGEEINGKTCVAFGEKAFKPNIFRLNFDGASANTTTYVDDIAVVDVDAELEYLDSTFEAECGVPSNIANSVDNIVLPLTYGNAKVEWVSSNNDVIDAGSMNTETGLTDVYHGDQVEDVTLTAKLTYTGISGYEADGLEFKSEGAHVINVSVEQSGSLTDEQKAKRVADNITLASSNVTEDFSLFSEAKNEDGTITGSVVWTSDDAAIIVNGDTAKVTRPSFNENDKTVTLTAAVTVGAATVTKEFKLTVVKNTVPVTDDEKAAYAEIQLTELGFSEEAARVVTSDIYLPTEIKDIEDNKAADIVWTSSDTDWMANNGALVQQPSSGSHPLTLTAVITAGAVSKTLVFDVTIRANATVKAFPGAQGYGTQTRGGAGGYIVHVTSLAADGPGTFKEAVEDKVGARTIVFDVGGTIDLTPLGRAIKLSGENGSNVTIAGQTAPGEGIQLKGYGFNLSNVTDVIVRHISIRIGNVRKAGDTYQSDPLSVSGANKRVVLDHLSMCWGVDMGFRVNGQEVTMSNCMISKGLYWNTPHEKGKHNYAGMFAAKYGSFYGNYIADCGQRAPRIVDNQYVDIRNNVVFNSKYTFDICNYEWMGANTKYNIVNNMVLKGNTAPGGSSSNTTTGGSYKYFQGRTYSGGVFAYSVNNYDDTLNARPLSGSTGMVEGALWTGDTSSHELDTVKKELYGFSPGGYSNITTPWRNMIFPSNISLDEYNDSSVSKMGNTLMNYPFAVPNMNTYATDEAVKYVLSNAGAKAPVRGILDNRYLAEGRTRLQVLSDYSKASSSYGIKLDMSYAGETAYGLPVQVHTVYEDENGITVYDVDGNTVKDPSKYTVSDQYKFVSCENHIDTLYAVDKKQKTKYRVVLREYEEGDGIYDAFDLYDISNNKLEKPNPYVSDSDSSYTDGFHWPNGIVLKYADWGDGAGNYDHADSGVSDGNIDTTVVDTEWTADDWPQLPTVYRDGDFDSNGDGIPDFFVKLMGWNKHPEYDSKKDISRLDFEGRGYTNLEYYINDYCAGDKEHPDSAENDPVIPENVRNGSSRYNTHKSHQILFNTVRRAKAKVYYCEGDVFDMANAKELMLNSVYDYSDEKYSSAEDFDTYFDVVVTGADSESDAVNGLMPSTTYSYKIKTYSDTGVEYLTPETYTFTTSAAKTGKPGTPRITKYVPFDNQITIDYEPASEQKTYKQTTFDNPLYSKASHILTTVSNNEYDTNIDYYVLRYSTNADLKDPVEIKLPSTSTSYVITDLSNDKEYYIDLRAVSTDGTESDSAVYYVKKAMKNSGEYDKNGNQVYSVKKMDVKNNKVVEYYSEDDAEFKTIAVQPTKFVVNENYKESFKELGIEDGETTKFTTIYADVKDWYIYTLGGIPIPTTAEGDDAPMLMLRDDLHEHGFTYAKKFATPLTGKSTVRCKLMIKDEVLDPMNQAPELRFYIQQDSADSEDTDADVESTSTKEATTFGNIVSLSFTKNELYFDGEPTGFKYTDGTWYDIKILMDGDTGTCSYYINDALIGKDKDYSESSTSTAIQRWQISSRLAGTEDVYIEYMYAYSGWDDLVIDPEATQKPDSTVEEGTSGLRPSGGGSSGGGGGGGGGGTVTASATPAPEATDNPEATPAVSEKPSAPDENTVTPHSFKDMTNYSWADEAVSSLYAKGIVNGITEEMFAPSREITRAEFVTLLMRGFNLLDKNAVCSFTDVPDGAWYYPAVAAASSMGVVKGLSENYFGAEDKVSRQDMAVMITRLLDSLGMETPDMREYPGFADDDEIADYAKKAVQSLYKSGIINGVGNDRFSPRGQANRAETAKMLYETIKILGD